MVGITNSGLPGPLRDRRTVHRAHGALFPDKRGSRDLWCAPLPLLDADTPTKGNHTPYKKKGKLAASRTLLSTPKKRGKV
jgi:hypothetical protein